jgi:hypothetical protein
MSFKGTYYTHAISVNDADTVEDRICAGKNVNALEAGVYPLALAAIQCNPKMVRLLLVGGAYHMVLHRGFHLLAAMLKFSQRPVGVHMDKWQKRKLEVFRMLREAGTPCDSGVFGRTMLCHCSAEDKQDMGLMLEVIVHGSYMSKASGQPVVAAKKQGVLHRSVGLVRARD